MSELCFTKLLSKLFSDEKNHGFYEFLCYMSYYSNDDCFIAAKHAQIAEALEKTPRQIESYFKKAEDLKIITILKRFQVGVYKTSPEIRKHMILIEKMDKILGKDKTLMKKIIERAIEK